jgi:hypothetical protein
LHADVSFLNEGCLIQVITAYQKIICWPWIRFWKHGRLTGLIYQSIGNVVCILRETLYCRLNIGGVPSCCGVFSSFLPSAKCAQSPPSTTTVLTACSYHFVLYFYSLQAHDSLIVHTFHLLSTLFLGPSKQSSSFCSLSKCITLLPRSFCFSSISLVPIS